MGGRSGLVPSDDRMSDGCGFLCISCNQPDLLGLEGSEKFEAEIAALGGPDALMSEVYYETLYVLSRCGEPYTIITRRHIIEVGYHIYPIAGIARVTKWTYSKSPFRMRLYYYGNGSERWEFARVGILRHAEYMNILQAILSVNPYVVMQ